ncbi:glutathione S-transferase 2-like [Culicoides brevitarsis]|uniref:glutathione S-transferase 2-like n=1 Tax=Culicoides brevitarsis TaxID=469753 RepID=UPI00307B7DEE
MSLKFYYIFESAEYREVILTADQLNVEVMTHKNSMSLGDNFKAQFLRYKPQELPPTFYDHTIGQALWETKAIIIYLAEKYDSQNCDLYPADPLFKARINEILFFDETILKKSFKDFWYPQVFEGKPGSFEKLSQMERALEHLDTLLARDKWAAGPHLTLADLVLQASIANFCVIGQKDIGRYENIERWHRNCEKWVKGFKKNITGALECKKLFDLLK